MDRVRRSVLQLVAAAAIVACVALVSTSAAAAGTLDQSQTNINSTGLAIGAAFGSEDQRRSAAQTFTAGRSGDLDRVDLNLRRVATPGSGSCNGGSGVTIEIRTVSAGAPGGSVLAGESLPASSITADTLNFYSFALTNPPVVTAGTQYALVASAPDASCTMGDFPYSWGGANPGPYSGGTALSKQNSTSSWQQEPGDGGFQTFVASPASTGGPIPGGTATENPECATLQKRLKKAKKKGDKKKVRKLRKRLAALSC